MVNSKNCKEVGIAKSNWGWPKCILFHDQMHLVIQVCDVRSDAASFSHPDRRLVEETHAHVVVGLFLGHLLLFFLGGAAPPPPPPAAGAAATAPPPPAGIEASFLAPSSSSSSRFLPLRESTTVLRLASSASTPTEERMALMSLAEGLSLPPRAARR